MQEMPETMEGNRKFARIDTQSFGRSRIFRYRLRLGAASCPPD